MESALAEPVTLGHGFDERSFGEGGCLMLVAGGGEESIEFGLRFGGEDAEASGETMARVVEGSGGLCGAREMGRNKVMRGQEIGISLWA